MVYFMAELEKKTFSCSYNAFNEKVSVYLHGIEISSHLVNGRNIHYELGENQDVYAVKRDGDVLINVTAPNEIIENIEKLIYGKKKSS
jgi:hypothetical protein